MQPRAGAARRDLWRAQTRHAGKRLVMDAQGIERHDALRDPAEELRMLAVEFVHLADGFIVLALIAIGVAEIVALYD